MKSAKGTEEQMKQDGIFLIKAPQVSPAGSYVREHLTQKG